jgi:fatty acid desaturase
VLPPGHWAADESISQPHDPAEAQQLLEAAGWTTDGDLLVDEAGEQFAFTLVYGAGDAGDRGAALAVADDLAGLGMQVELESAGHAVMVDHLAEGTPALNRTGTVFDPDLDFLDTFHSSRKNDWLTLIFGNFLLGLSRQWGIDKHNEHHGHPNQMDLDPDVDIPLLAFEEEQALEKRGFARFVVKYQAALIFPLSLLQALSMHRSSIRFLFEKRARSTLVEALVMGAHFVLYFGLIFSVLEPLQALLFIAVHRGLFGMFMVSIFAPNHKAMPVLERESQLDFLRRQVLTSRNVIAHPITDFWYGGLNYQIEHHLFPRLPRNKLREAQQIDRDFCRDHSIAYHETSVLQSYREILHHLHEVGAPLREARTAR